MDASFNADAVFGTYVCTTENDDYLNDYAKYDLETGQVHDTLTVILVQNDGDTEYRNRLSDAEQAAMLTENGQLVPAATGPDPGAVSGSDTWRRNRSCRVVLNWKCDGNAYGNRAQEKILDHSLELLLIQEQQQRSPELSM